MGYDLKANNEGVEGFHFGAFSWGWMLGEGVGLIIGYGKLDGAAYVYEPREVTYTTADGEAHTLMTDPCSNDGYPVDADEAMAMAHAAHGLVNVERAVARMHAELPPEEQARREALPLLDRNKPRMPVREDFIERVERFAEWAEKSGGFRVY